ncbi:MAG: 5-formyltetrahydrofolate cyclo-ligase [Actinomycetota bacterium]|nr:5-formyltetrahydrofolate cyclo-ligase [Actinomycetota bacterium]
MDKQGNKSELRKLYRRQRADRFNAESWLHILSATELKNATNVASYISYEFEPETSDINQRLIKDGKKVFLPRLLENSDIQWVRWDGLTENLTKVEKIYEPIGDAVEVELDVIILPALHVDRMGNRLGQGGGSFDRALSRSKAFKIALLHYGELTSEILPVQPHDEKVDAAATPEIIVRF